MSEEEQTNGQQSAAAAAAVRSQPVTSLLVGAAWLHDIRHTARSSQKWRQMKYLRNPGELVKKAIKNKSYRIRVDRQQWQVKVPSNRKKP